MAPKLKEDARIVVSDNESELSDSPSMAGIDEDTFMSNAPTTPKAQSTRSTRHNPSISYEEPDSPSEDERASLTRKGKSKQTPPYTPPSSSRKRKQKTPKFRGGKRRKTDLQALDDEDDDEAEGDFDAERTILQRLPAGVELKKVPLDSGSALERLPAEVSHPNVV